MAGILDAAAGTDDALPAGFWGDLLPTQGRSVSLAVLAALIGFGLANLTRNTGAALGIGFVYFAILETAIRILRPMLGAVAAVEQRRRTGRAGWDHRVRAERRRRPDRHRVRRST